MKQVSLNPHPPTPQIGQDFCQSINNLPNELIEFIFKNFLELPDLAISSSVCKKWKVLTANVMQECHDETFIDRILNQKSLDDIELCREKIDSSISLSNYAVKQITKKLNNTINRDEYELLTDKIVRIAHVMSLDNLMQLVCLTKNFIFSDDYKIHFRALYILSDLTRYANQGRHCKLKYSVDQLQKTCFIYLKQSIVLEKGFHNPCVEELQMAFTHMGKLGGSKLASESLREMCFEELASLLPANTQAVAGLSWIAVSPYITLPLFQKILSALELNLDRHPKIATELLSNLSNSTSIPQEFNQMAFNCVIKHITNHNEIVRGTIWEGLKYGLKNKEKRAEFVKTDIDFLKLCQAEANPTVLVWGIRVLRDLSKQLDEGFVSRVKGFLVDCIIDKNRNVRVRQAGLRTWKALLIRKIKNKQVLPQEFVEPLFKFTNHDQVEILDTVLEVFSRMVRCENISNDLYIIYVERLVRLSQSSVVDVAYEALRNLADIEIRKNLPLETYSHCAAAFLNALKIKKLCYQGVSGLVTFVSNGIISDEFYAPVCESFIRLISHEDNFVRWRALSGLIQLGFSKKSDTVMHKKCVDSLNAQSLVIDALSFEDLARSLQDVVYLDWLPSHFHETMCRALICLARRQTKPSKSLIRNLRDLIIAPHIKNELREECFAFLVQWISGDKNIDNRKLLLETLSFIARDLSSTKALFKKCMQTVLETSKEEHWEVLDALAATLFTFALANRENSPRKCLGALMSLASDDGIDIIVQETALTHIKNLYLSSESHEEIRAEACGFLFMLSNQSKEKILSTVVSCLGEIAICPHTPLPIKENCLRDLLRHSSHENDEVRWKAVKALLAMILTPSIPARLKKMCARVVMIMSNNQYKWVRFSVAAKIESLLQIAEIEPFHTQFTELLFRYITDKSNLVRKEAASTLGILAGSLSASEQFKSQYQQAINNIFDDTKNQVFEKFIEKITTNYKEKRELNDEFTNFICQKIIKMFENDQIGDTDAAECLGAIAGAVYISKGIRQQGLDFLFELAENKNCSYRRWCSVEGLGEAILSKDLEEDTRTRCMEFLVRLSKDRHHRPKTYALEKLKLYEAAAIPAGSHSD